MHQNGHDSASVLIIDDDVDIALGLHDLLSFMGLKVTVAHTGADALALTEHGTTFDVALLDLMLPDMDGLAVLPALHAADPTLPVIIVTAFTDIPKKHGSLTEGAFAYLTKPFDTEELKALVRRAIGMKQLSGEVAEAKQALTASEERFHEVVETATDAIILADDEGRVISWNPAAQSLFGYTVPEVTGRPLTILMPPRYHQAHIEALERVSRTGAMRHKGRVIQVRGRRKDGTEFDVEMSLSSWLSQGRRYFCGILRDVTARLEAERRLQRQQIEQQTLLDLIPAMVWYKDDRNRILRTNRLAAESIGKTVEDVEGQSTYDLYPDEAAKYYQDDLDVIRSGQPKLGIVERYQTGTGEKHWVQTDKVPYCDRDGSVLGVLVFAQDITDRKRAEEALRLSGDRLRLLIDSSPVGVVLVDDSGTIVESNAAAAVLFGYRAEELRDRPLSLILSGSALTADSAGTTMVGTAKDGTDLPVEVRRQPYPASDGFGRASTLLHLLPVAR
jgi:PAS domain S-box-containing protein